MHKTKKQKDHRKGGKDSKHFQNTGQFKVKKIHSNTENNITNDEKELENNNTKYQKRKIESNLYKFQTEVDEEILRKEYLEEHNKKIELLEKEKLNKEILEENSEDIINNEINEDIINNEINEDIINDENKDIDDIEMLNTILSTTNIKNVKKLKILQPTINKTEDEELEFLDSILNK
jgi:hypothetical protein